MADTLSLFAFILYCVRIEIALHRESTDPYKLNQDGDTRYFTYVFNVRKVTNSNM